IDHILSAAQVAGTALKSELEARDLELGRDVAVVISADAIHYGDDFKQTRYGAGQAAYDQAVAEDLRILRTLLAGRMDGSNAQRLLETFVDPDAESLYRWTWCGRFAIPFGIMMLDTMASVTGWPIAYETSISAPPLDVPQPGFTAPASLE